jgi:hypothetical protein
MVSLESVARDKKPASYPDAIYHLAATTLLLTEFITRNQFDDSTQLNKSSRNQS